MSLAVLADHMASKGRGPDSMLIHMSPREVQGLQALAMKHGGSLTINPDTGLPEAGFLDKLLPTIIGAGISFFSGGAITPMQAAMIVGGVQTARTGDIGKGISAGIGAYGGAGLTAGMSTAGSEAIGSQAAGQSYLASAPGVLEGAGAGLSADMAYNLANAGVTDTVAANAAQQAAAERVAAASPWEKLSTGAEKVASNPMSFANKDNLKYLAAAAGPAIMAGANVQAKGPQTVTKPGMIRPYVYDPYGGGYVAGAPYEAAPTRAAEGGLMGMAQGGGMFDFVQRSEPVVRMAEGGLSSVVRMAGGTPPTMLTDEQLYQKTGSWEAAAAARDAQNNAMNQYNWQQAAAERDAAANAANAAKFNTAAADYVKAAAIPTETAQQFITGAQQAGIGLTQPLATALQNSGLSAAAQYALTHADIGSPLNTEETYGGLKGLSSNINYVAGGLQNLIGAGKLTGQGAREQALTEMNKYGINEADILRATGKTLKELFPDTVVKPTTVIPSGYYGNATTGVAETTTPGDITTNPDGTVTVHPNIPGRPEGGFTGMGQVKDVYTAGGGSLGYTPFVPKTIEEFDAKYNKLTGGSKQSYDYLMGKTPYSPIPYTPTGEVMKPYAESVLGMPVNTSKRMFIFDPATKTYKVNPDYAIPTYDASGKKTYNVTNKDVQTYMATKPSNTDFYNWAKTNNLTAEQIAAATGMPITEVQKMLTGGTPADTTTAGGAGTKTASVGGVNYDLTDKTTQPPGDNNGDWQWSDAYNKWVQIGRFAYGGLTAMAARGGAQYDLGDYSDGGRLLRGPGDGVSDSIPASIGNKRPARLADGEFVVPARIVSELGNGSTEAGARKLYAMMDRIQSARRSTVGKGKVAKNSRADKHLPA